MGNISGYIFDDMEKYVKQYIYFWKEYFIYLYDYIFNIKSL